MSLRTDNIFLPDVFSILADIRVGEVAALASESVEEGTAILRRLINELDALGAEDAAARIAEAIRIELELEPDDVEFVTVLETGQSDRWDQICARAVLPLAST